jgi:hypothetical protein
MRTFKDADGREWAVEVTMRTVRSVREATDGRVDLLAVFTPEFSQLLADPFVLAAVLYAVCRKRAEEKAIDADGFADGLRGDALDAASTALLEAVADFFPSRQRELLLVALVSGERTEAERYARVMENLIHPSGSDGPTGSPGPSALTPDPSASDS